MAVLDTFLANLTAKLTAYNEAKATYDKYIVDTTGAENWYNHLVSIQAWNNHPVEWAASKQDFELTIVPQRAVLANAVTIAKANYDQAKKEYDDAKTNLATPAEIEAIQIKEQIALTQAQNKADQDASAKKLSEYKAITTKYVIIAGVILTVIVVASWAYFKFIKKGAKA